MRSRTTDLGSKAELLHVRLVVPEQPLVIHYAGIRPVPDCCHGYVKLFAGRLDKLSVADWHGLREGSHQPAGDRSPMAVSDLDRVFRDLEIGYRDEHRFQVLDVFVEPAGIVAVRPAYDYVL